MNYLWSLICFLEYCGFHPYGIASPCPARPLIFSQSSPLLPAFTIQHTHPTSNPFSPPPSTPHAIGQPDRIAHSFGWHIAQFPSDECIASTTLMSKWRSTRRRSRAFTIEVPVAAILLKWMYVIIDGTDARLHARAKLWTMPLCWSGFHFRVSQTVWETCRSMLFIRCSKDLFQIVAFRALVKDWRKQYFSWSLFLFPSCKLISMITSALFVDFMFVQRRIRWHCGWIWFPFTWVAWIWDMIVTCWSDQKSAVMGHGHCRRPKSPSRLLTGRGPAGMSKNEWVSHPIDMRIVHCTAHPCMRIESAAGPSTLSSSASTTPCRVAPRMPQEPVGWPSMGTLMADDIDQVAHMHSMHQGRDATPVARLTYSQCSPCPPVGRSYHGGCMSLTMFYHSCNMLVILSQHGRINIFLALSYHIWYWLWF